MKHIKTLVFVSVIAAGLVGCGTKSDSAPSVETVRAQSVKDSPTPYPVSDSERTQAVDQLVEFRKTMLALEGKLIAPAKEDLEQYAEFLKEPNSGLARIFPRYAGTERRPLLVSGQGAYYQFKRRTNEYGYGSDIQYSTSNSPLFSVGFAGVNFGFLAQLGKMDIRQADMQNPIVGFALSYTPPSGQGEPAWRAEQRKWSNGQTNGNIVFKDRTEAIVGMTYVVRSIDEGSYDTATIFQVVRRDPTDGSLIIAWKILKEFGKPTLK